jgi:hypothetical protein
MKAKELERILWTIIGPAFVIVCGASLWVTSLYGWITASTPLAIFFDTIWLLFSVFFAFILRRSAIRTLSEESLASTDEPEHKD